MHYKAIRQGHRGRSLPPQTRQLLFSLRHEEIELERRLQQEIKDARASGRCPALIMPTIAVSTPYREIPATPGGLCGEEAFRRGYCVRHFLTHVLYLRDRRSSRAGRGITRRPFVASQLPYGRLSEKQCDLMNDLKRLPMPTPLEECISRLNEEDPSNPIEPTGRKAGAKGANRR